VSSFPDKGLPDDHPALLLSCCNSAEGSWPQAELFEEACNPSNNDIAAWEAVAIHDYRRKQVLLVLTLEMTRF
jgi:hypothetical protein